MGFIGQHKVVVMITTGAFSLLLLTLLAIFLATHLSSGSNDNSGISEGKFSFVFYVDRWFTSEWSGKNFNPFGNKYDFCKAILDYVK